MENTKEWTPIICPHCSGIDIHAGPNVVFDQFKVHWCRSCDWEWAKCWGEWRMAKSLIALETTGGEPIAKVKV